MIRLNRFLANSDDHQEPIDRNSLHRLVTGSKWGELRTLLATHEGRESVKVACSASSTSVFRLVGRNILHDLLSNDPPADIAFSMICALGQDFLTQRDSNDCGRNPFHCALRHRASQEVIDTILSMYPDVAAISDDNGVTPLMIECSMGKRCQLATVKVLVTLAPHQVTKEDKDGATALEYALMSGATSTFRELQSYQADELRKRSEDEQMDRLKMDYLGKGPMQSVTVIESMFESMASIEPTEDVVMLGQSTTNARQVTRSSRAA